MNLSEPTLYKCKGGESLFPKGLGVKGLWWAKEGLRKKVEKGDGQTECFLPTSFQLVAVSTVANGSLR